VSTAVIETIGAITFVVRDYDEAIAFFTERLDFVLIEDTPLDANKRWVLVAPPGGGVRLLLAKASGEQQAARVGDQTGGRVFLFLNTDDFTHDHARLQAKGVRFVETPRHEPYGWVAVFEDLWGNRWDLLQLNRKDAAESGR
jgi:catechol 2,3-dioxygenase-like lactoylglutathione lyase family enzyme